MRSDGFDPRVLKFCAYTGFAFAFMWPFAAIVAAHGQYIWPPSAADSAHTVVADYLRHTTGIRVAAILMINIAVLYTTWGMGISMMTKRREDSWPILFYIQVVSLACCVVVVMLIGFFWGAAAWRPGETSPEVTQAFNDLGWLGVLFTGAPFASFQLALAAGTLLDKSPTPVFPRWSGYVNIFVSLFMFDAGLLIFFKTGPLSQNGAIVFYMPMAAFFIWIAMFSVLTLKAINAESERGAPAEADDPGRDRVPIAVG